MKEALSSHAAALGLAEHVHFPGLVDDPCCFFSLAKCFVLSSVFEGLPVGDSCSGDVRKIGPNRNPVALSEAILANPPHPECLKRRARAFSTEASVHSYLQLLLGHAADLESPPLARRHSA